MSRRKRVRRLEKGDRVISTTAQFASELTLQDWHDNGRPELWVVCDVLEVDKSTFRLFESAGNGRLALTLEDKDGHDMCVDVNSGEFPVRFADSAEFPVSHAVEVIGLGAYYGSSAKLYSR
jgi:hypothetical protein